MSLLSPILQCDFALRFCITIWQCDFAMRCCNVILHRDLAMRFCIAIWQCDFYLRLPSVQAHYNVLRERGETYKTQKRSPKSRFEIGRVNGTLITIGLMD